MTVILYKKTNFQDPQLSVCKNYKSLKNTPIKNKSSSLKILTSLPKIRRQIIKKQIIPDYQKVLLFKARNYKGPVMFRRDTLNISKINSKRHGGKPGFGNTISSVRVTPFFVNLNVNIIQTDNGNFPGPGSPNQKYIKDMITFANSIWAQGLIQFRLKNLSFRRSTKHHFLKREFVSLVHKYFWNKENHVNIHIVGDLHKAKGIATHPAHSKWIKTYWDVFGVKEEDPDAASFESEDYQAAVIKFHNDTDLDGEVLSHELGHVLGLLHISTKKADNDPEAFAQNVMLPGGLGDFRLTDNQIERVHEVLANNKSRKKLRKER